MRLLGQKNLEGDWEKAIQTLKRASVLDKTNRTKRKIAQLHLEYGDSQEGLNWLLEIAGEANSTAEDIERISKSIVQNKYWQELLAFLAPNIVRFPDNYRLRYLAAIANEELGNTEIAKQQFIKLVQVDQEIPSTNTFNLKQFQKQQSTVKEALPQSAVDLKRILSVVPRSAYSYRSSNSRGPWGRLSTRLDLPGDLQECHEYSLSHLRVISQNLPQKELDELRGQLDQIGIENTHLLLADVYNLDLFKDPMALLEIDPDNKAALALAAVASREADLPQEVCLKAYDTFKESHPSLSLLAAFKLDQTNPENQTLLAAAIKRLENIKEPDSALISFIRTKSNRTTGPYEQHQEQFNQLLFDWYPKMSWRDFGSVVAVFREEKSPKRLIKFLDRELEQIKRQGGRQRINSRYANRYTGNRISYNLPVFPPTVLFAFPSKVATQLSSIPANQLAAATRIAKDPTMKVLLALKYFQLRDNGTLRKTIAAEELAEMQDLIKAAFADEVTDPKSAIDQLFKISAENVDALYLAGVLATSEKRWNDAANNFEKARGLPMTAQARRTIDGHLIALAKYGLANNIHNEKYANVLRLARSAALRLRRGGQGLRYEQRIAFIGILELLDLNKEAAEMSSRTWRMANPRASGTTRATVSLDKLEALKKEGKTKAILEILIREFQVIARQELNLNTMDKSDWKSLKQKAEKVGMKSQLIKQFDPGKSTSARKLGTWAFAQEILGEKDIAESAYKKLLESHPRENGARLRYLLLNHENAGEMFAAQFSEVNKRSQGKFFEKMIYRMQRGMPILNTLSLAESVVKYKDGDDGDSISDTSMLSLLNILASTDTVKLPNGRKLTPLYRIPNLKKSTREKTEQEKEAEVAENRRRDLHDRIALGLTDSKMPGQAAKGFTALLASTEAADKPLDEQIVSLALKTVYDAKNTSAFFQANQGYSQPYYVIQRTPVQFLARHYGYSDVAEDEQVESIAKKLESIRARDDAAQLRNLYRLCRVSEDKFHDVATDLVNTAKGRPRRPHQTKWQMALSTVAETWKDRKIQTDISSLWIDYAARKSFGPNRTVSPTEIPRQHEMRAVTYFMQQNSLKDDLAKTEDFMNRLRLKLLGDERQQQELSKLLVNQESVIKNSRKLEPVGTYYFIAQTLKSRETFWLAAKEMRRFRYPFPTNDFTASEVYGFLSNFSSTENDLLLAWLGQTNVLSDLSDFEPFFKPKVKGPQTSVWGETLKLIAGRSSHMKPGLEKQLSAKSDRTFGESLFLATLEKKPANIYQLLGEDLETFNSLPAERQLQLASFVSEIITNDTARYGQNLLAKLPTTKESEAAKQKCSELKLIAKRAEVAKLLAAKRLQDLGIRDQNFVSWSKTFLASNRELPPQELLAAVKKIDQFASDPAVASRINQQKTNFKSQLIIESVVNRKIDSDSMRLILATLDDNDLQDVSFSQSLNGYVASFFTNELDAKRAKLPPSTPILDAMEPLIIHIGDEFGDRDFTALIPEFKGVIDAMNRADSKAIDKWLHSNIEIKYPKIKKAFRLAFECDRDLKTQQKNRTSRGTAAERPIKAQGHLKEVLDFVTDDSNTLQARFKVAMYLIQFKTLSCEGVTSCSRVIAEGFDAGQSFDSRQIDPIFAALMQSSDAPGFKEATVTFTKSWIQSLKRRNLYCERRNVINCLKTLALTGDKAEVASLLDVSSRYAHHEIGITLIELGFLDEAKEHFELIWAGDHMLQSHLYGAALYTNKLESELPALFENFDDEGSKYFAELYFASFANSSPAKSIKTTNKERVTALMDRFSTVKFKSKRRRQLSLILLANWTSKPEIVDQPLTQEVKDLSINTLFTNNRSNIYAELFGAYFSTQIKLRNFEPVQAKWKEINQLVTTRYPTGIQGQARNTIQKLAQSTRDSFTKMLRDQTPEQIAKLLPVFRDLNDPSYRMPLDLQTAQLVHLLAGRPDELADFVKEKRVTVLPNTPAIPKQSKLLNEFILSLNNSFSQVSPTNPEVRINFARSAWQYAKSQGFNFGLSAEKQRAAKSTFTANDHERFRRNLSTIGIEQLALRGILTSEQLLKVGPELAAIDSNNGETWLQLARRQVRASQFEKAAESYKKSIDEATGLPEIVKLNRQVEYANVLVALNRNKEAKKLIEKARPEQMFRLNKRTLEKLTKTLKVN